MKKEVFIAIIIGFVIGLLITFGIVTAQRSLKNSQALQNPGQTVNLSPTPAVNSNPQNITISNPENGRMVTNELVTITGTTAPHSLLAILGAKDYATIPSDEQGNFSHDIRLQEGANQIIIKSFDPQGVESQEELTVIYIPDSNPADPTPTNPKQKTSLTPKPSINL